jgi:predicted transcriptional regulator
MLNIRVPKQLADDLRRLAADTERSVTATARIALRAHVERERDAADRS